MSQNTLFSQLPAYTVSLQYQPPQSSMGNGPIIDVTLVQTSTDPAKGPSFEDLLRIANPSVKQGLLYNDMSRKERDLYSFSFSIVKGAKGTNVLYDNIDIEKKLHNYLDRISIYDDFLIVCKPKRARTAPNASAAANEKKDSDDDTVAQSPAKSTVSNSKDKEAGDKPATTTTTPSRKVKNAGGGEGQGPAKRAKQTATDHDDDEKPKSKKAKADDSDADDTELIRDDKK